MTAAGPWGGERGPAADLSLDVRGEVCPHPVMLTLDQLDRMEQGQILEVIVDCPSALVNVPVEVDRHGHELVGEPLRRGAEAAMLIRCSRMPADASRQTVETRRRGPAKPSPERA